MYCEHLTPKTRLFEARGNVHPPKSGFRVSVVACGTQKELALDAHGQVERAIPGPRHRCWDCRYLPLSLPAWPFVLQAYGPQGPRLVGSTTRRAHSPRTREPGP